MATPGRRALNLFISVPEHEFLRDRARRQLRTVTDVLRELIRNAARQEQRTLTRLIRTRRSKR